MHKLSRPCENSVASHRIEQNISLRLEARLTLRSPGASQSPLTTGSATWDSIRQERISFSHHGSGPHGLKY
jgi:hypothetical protein